MGYFLPQNKEGETYFYNEKDGGLLFKIANHSESVHINSDQNSILIGDTDGNIFSYNMKTGDLELSFKEKHDYDVTSIDVSPINSTLIASGSWDDTIRLWNSETGNCLNTLEGHTSSIESVSFSPNGKLLASGSWDRTVKLWDVSTGECVQTLKGHDNWVEYVAFSPSGKYLASGSRDSKFKLWDVSSGECIYTSESSQKKIACYGLKFTPDGEYLVVSDFSGSIDLWSLSFD